MIDRSALLEELLQRNNRTYNDGMAEMLRIDIQSGNSTATLICSGHLVLGVETETLRTMVQSRKEKNVIVDLSGVEKIDASGLGLLVELQAWARENGRTLTLMNLSENVWRLVILTKLYDALEISDADFSEFTRQNGDFGRNELIA
jgi:anti-sigma B factor antagonist